MPPLPALVTRPLRPADLADADAAADAAVAVALAPEATLDVELDAGVPARLPLDGASSLVLAVPLGVARAVMGLDPLAVLVDTRVPVHPDGEARAVARPRLTLVDHGVLADTAPAVAGVRQRLGHGGAGVVEIVVDLLVLTAGTLRSPGRFGSRIRLRWRSLAVAPSTGPPPPLGDPTIPGRAVPAP